MSDSSPTPEYTCNNMTQFTGCGSTVMVMYYVYLACITLGFLLSLTTAVSKWSLLKGADWRKLNGAQQLVVVLPASIGFAFLGSWAGFYNRHLEASTGEVGSERSPSLEPVGSFQPSP
jgi:hypothetical protein